MTSEKKNKGGRPRGISITKTDENVLTQIANEHFQNFGELRKFALQANNRQHSWRIMKRLSQAGFLHPSIGDENRILGWSLTSKGRERLGLEEEENASKKRPPIYRTSYDHDNVLREIKAILCQSQAIVEWVPESTLKAELFTKLQYRNPRNRMKLLRAVPDAILHINSGDEDSKAVLELEITRKSKSRWFQKLESYITSADIDYALFIVDGDDLFDAIWSVYEDVLENSNRVKNDTDHNGIYFSKLADIKQKGIKANFQSTDDAFTLAELAA